MMILKRIRLKEFDIVLLCTVLIISIFGIITIFSAVHSDSRTNDRLWLAQIVRLAIALVAMLAMEDVSRAYEKGETKGFMKILVDRDSKQILGASLLGLAGDEVIHSILDLMYAKAPYTVMQRAMHIHPTVSEFIPTMLGDLKPLQ